LIKDVIKSFCPIDRVTVTPGRRRVIMMKRLRMGGLVMVALKLLEVDTLKRMPAIVKTLMVKSGLLGLRKISVLRKCQPRLIR
jgi:hypothetical protein